MGITAQEFIQNEEANGNTKFKVSYARTLEQENEHQDISHFGDIGGGNFSMYERSVNGVELQTSFVLPGIDKDLKRKAIEDVARETLCESGELDETKVQTWIDQFIAKLDDDCEGWDASSRFWVTWNIENPLSKGLFERLRFRMGQRKSDVIALNEKKEREYTACSIYQLECAKDIFEENNNVCYVGSGSTKTHVTCTRGLVDIKWRELATVVGSESRKFGTKQNDYSRVAITMPKEGTETEIYCVRTRRSDNISECHEINTVLKLTDYWKKSGWGRWATVVLKDIMILDAPAPGIRRNNQPQGTAFNCNFIRDSYFRKSSIRNAFISDFKLCKK